MTARDKNLLLMFLTESGADNGCAEKWEKTIRNLTQLAYKLGIKDGGEQMRYFMELEDELSELFQMTKETYFNFGVTAKEVTEDYNLEKAA